MLRDVPEITARGPSPTRSDVRVAAALLALALLLGACGQRGPLYLPEEPARADAQQQPAAADEENGEQGEADGGPDR